MFSQQNGIIYFINKLVDMILLSVLWILFSLPIITLGASSAALYHAVVRVIQEDIGYSRQDFIHSFKINLRQSLPITIFSLLFTAAFSCGLFFRYINSGKPFSQLYGVFSLICLLLILLIQILVYSLIGRFQLNGKQLFILLIRLIGKHIFRNFLLLCLLIFVLEAAVYYPPLLLILPSGFSYLVSLLEEPVFKKYIRTDED